METFYFALLDEQYREYLSYSYSGASTSSKLDFIADEIFDITTSDGGDDSASDILAKRMLDVISCILNKTTFEYLEYNYLNYMTMVNMPFIKDKIEWGTSIRGAWFDTYRADDYPVNNSIYIPCKDIERFLSVLIAWSGYKPITGQELTVKEMV